MMSYNSRNKNFHSKTTTFFIIDWLVFSVVFLTRLNVLLEVLMLSDFVIDIILLTILLL